MKILIITDTWNPSINGVVTTMNHVVSNLTSMGHEVLVIEPSLFKRIPLSIYPDVVTCFPLGLERKIREFNPDTIHIVTEYVLGISSALICLKNGWRFTTSYHTKFPEYIQKYYKIPKFFTYKLVRFFHNLSSGTMVATNSLYSDLKSKGFKNLVMWSRGVDNNLFKPNNEYLNMKELYRKSKCISLLYVGRVSKEKNIEDFLKIKDKIDINGESYTVIKTVIGDGPDLDYLKKKYETPIFLGAFNGFQLSVAYPSANAFIFPSKTDTFGLVILEALASGTPVLAYNVTGPKDILTEETGYLCNNNLEEGLLEVINKKEEDCLALAAKYSWKECAKKFINNLVLKNEI